MKSIIVIGFSLRYTNKTSKPECSLVKSKSTSHDNQILVKYICGEKNYQALAKRLKSTRQITTAAMRQTIAFEPVAAEAYGYLKD